MYAIVCCQKQNNVNHVTKPSVIAPRPRRWGNEDEWPGCLIFGSNNFVPGALFKSGYWSHETVRNLYFHCTFKTNLLLFTGLRALFRSFQVYCFIGCTEGE